MFPHSSSGRRHSALTVRAALNSQGPRKLGTLIGREGLIRHNRRGPSSASNFTPKPPSRPPATVARSLHQISALNVLSGEALETFDFSGGL